MKKVIKSGKNIGVAQQVQGLEVDTIPHPKFNGLWQFQVDVKTDKGIIKETWMASDYAFKEEGQENV